MKLPMRTMLALMGMLFALFGSMAVRADDGAVEPITLLVNFKITGNFTAFDPATGNSTYTINGPGYAPPFIGVPLIPVQKHTVGFTDNSGPLQL
ncbi:MAG: hypothetical protein ACYDDO_09645 [Acidiferrobacterales bacterium]